MNKDYRSASFKGLLKKLQQESWQLELLISGFVIYALVIAYDPLMLKLATAVQKEEGIYVMLWSAIYISWSILLFNLVLHVILRGIWIGAIGLRYVSGDIDYKQLNYSEKFTIYLKKKVGTFDRYISRLENYCSIVFALSFLLIFYMLSAMLVLGTITSLGVIISKLDFIPKTILKVVTYCSMTFITIGTLLTLIDFFGQGVLKKRKWTSIVYFPFYRVFSIITLSFLYRPLVYNFLDNKFGKRISLFLVPIYVIISFATEIEYQPSNYIFNNQDSSEQYSNTRNYEDLINAEATLFTEFVSIPSKVIETPYLKVFLVFSSKIEDFIFENNKSLKPEKDARGFTLSDSNDENSGSFISINLDDKIDNIAKKRKDYLNTINNLYKIKIDSLEYKSDFIITENKKLRLGFETFLNIKNISEGKHILRVFGPKKSKDKTKEVVLATIPFWRY